MAGFGWTDAAEWQASLDGTPPDNTYSLNGDFEADSNVTRIDAILMNEWAKAMFHRFWLTQIAGHQHKRLHLQLNARLYDAPSHSPEDDTALPSREPPSHD